MQRRPATATFWIAASLSLVGACAQKETPEERVRAVIASAVEAAESGNTAALRAQVATGYADGYGNDRHALERLLRLYVLTHRPLHLYTHVSDVTFSSAERATAVVFAAMAGERIDRSDLPRVRASLYRFELELVPEEGEWRLIKAAWRPANLADF